VLLQWPDLPDTVTLTWSPRPQFHESERKEPFDRVIDATYIDAEAISHSRPAVIGRPMAIRCERKQEQDGGRIGLQPL
jgi:hypothetical protein